MPPLRAAGEKLGDRSLLDAANRIAYYKAQPDLVEFKPQIGTLSHIFGYMTEGLTQLGEYDLALRGLQQAADIQTADGAVPAYQVHWVCSTGVAQLALAWYAIGDTTRADAALGYRCRIQNEVGGFYGGYGRGETYFRMPLSAHPQTFSIRRADLTSSEPRRATFSMQTRGV